MSAETYLGQYGITVQQARDFIVSNLNNLPYIIDVCSQFGVTNQMLAEIYGGVSKSDVVNFFATNGVDSTSLDSDLGAAPNFEITQNTDEGFEHFGQKISVFNIPVYASNGVDDDKLIHAATVLAEYLDNNEDGIVDNRLVVDSLIANSASLTIFGSEADMDDFFDSADSDGEEPNTVSLLNDEISLEWHIGQGPFDASLEEVLHLVTQLGYAQAYPEVFGELPGSDVADAMDIARGGQFLEIPDEYPDDAWFAYYDDTADYATMVTEYTYWSLTSLLGAQATRGDEIGEEWGLYTPESFQSGDRAMYDIITNPDFDMPTQIPDGIYLA